MASMRAPKDLYRLARFFLEVALSGFGPPSRRFLGLHRAKKRLLDLSAGRLRSQLWALAGRQQCRSRRGLVGELVNELFFVEYHYSIEVRDQFPTSMGVHFQEKNLTPFDLPIDQRNAFFRAKVIVASGECRFLDFVSEDQRLIYLWHGCGSLKKVGRYGAHAKSYELIPPPEIIVSSTAVREAYADSFRVSINAIHALGLPRTDVFFSHRRLADARSAVLGRHPQWQGKRIYLFAPTFQDEPRVGCFVSADLDGLRTLLGPDELFVVKHHPAVLQKIKTATRDEITNVPSGGTGFEEASEESIFDLTVVCDHLMTDYSSSIFEAMLLNKPITFLRSSFQKNRRGFYVDIDAELPESLVNDDAPSLYDRLRFGQAGSPAYLRFREYHMGACDGRSTKRVVSYLSECRGANNDLC